MVSSGKTLILIVSGPGFAGHPVGIGIALSVREGRGCNPHPNGRQGDLQSRFIAYSWLTLATYFAKLAQRFVFVGSLKNREDCNKTTSYEQEKV